MEPVLPPISAEDDKRLIDTFIELVRIDSPSHEEGRLAEWCARAFAEIGCAVRIDDTAPLTGSDTGNLIAELPGTTPGVLVLSAHMDCVEPCRGVEPVVADGLIRPATETVLGADDKAGIAAILEAMRRLAVLSMPHPTVRAVLSVCEEVGLKGAKHLIAADVTGDACLVLDADGPVGGIVVGAPTHYTFAAVFTGRASHAGVAPEQGVSAIAMAARAVAAMRLGRLDEHTTANVGTISGGSATNVVAPRVVLTGECRSLERSRVEDVRREMDTVMHQAAAAFAGRVDVTWQLEYEGFSVEPDSPLLECVTRACSEAGIESRTFTTGGGSDANIIASFGVPVLALSCGMRGVHSTSESIAVADLVALERLVLSVALTLGECA